jgi:hypothetical protein
MYWSCFQLLGPSPSILSLKRVVFLEWEWELIPKNAIHQIHGDNDKHSDDGSLLKDQEVVSTGPMQVM